MAPETVVNGIGTAAGLCSMSSFVPQLIKVAREKSAEGVSLRTYVVNVIGFGLWITYGVLLGSWPVAASRWAVISSSASLLNGWIRAIPSFRRVIFPRWSAG